MVEDFGARPAGVSPERTMAAQLRAWGFPSVHDSSQSSIRALSQALSDVSSFAKAQGLPLAVSLEFGRVALDYGQGWRQGWARGTAMVDFGRIMDGFKFMAPEAEGVQAAIDAGLTMFMSRHPFLCKGWSDDLDWEGPLISGPDADMVDAWVDASLAKGGPCARFVEILKQEAHAHPLREAIRVELQARLARCAQSGLIPSVFKTAALALAGGLDGAPTWIASMRVDDPKGSPSLSGKAFFDLMRPSSAVSRAQRDSWEWALPSLAAGVEPMWSSLCASIAHDLAKGWSYEEFGDVAAEHAQGHASAIERVVIGEAITNPGAFSKRPSI